MNIRITESFQSPIDIDLKQLVKRKVVERFAEGRLEQLAGSINNLTELMVNIIDHINPTNEQLTNWLGQYGETLEKHEV